jgi:hypothetical protein
VGRNLSVVLRKWLLPIVAVTAVLGVTGCSTPSATARACSAKTKLEASVTAWRGFDFTNPDATKLADIVNSMTRPLSEAQAGVPLAQNSRLRDLGGANHLRQLNRDLQQTVQQLRTAQRGSEEQLVFQLRPTITTQVGQVQQVADAISGC